MTSTSTIPDSGPNELFRKQLCADLVKQLISLPNFDRSNQGIYEDIYSTPGHKKYYVVDDVLENFISKAGQHIEVLKLTIH